MQTLQKPFLQFCNRTDALLVLSTIDRAIRFIELEAYDKWVYVVLGE